MQAFIHDASTLPYRQMTSIRDITIWWQTNKRSKCLPSDSIPGPLLEKYAGLELGESGSGPYSVNTE